MKLLNQRGYLSHNLRRGGTAGGAGISFSGGAAAAVGTGTRRGNIGTSGGVLSLTPSRTHARLGAKSTQVALSSGNGARARW